MITVYILKSRTNGKRYIGITNNLERRLREHRHQHTKGGQVLGAFNLVRTEPFKNYEEARRREKFLKSCQGRKWMKENLEG